MLTKALIDISKLGLAPQKLEVWFSSSNVHIKKSWQIECDSIDACIDLIREHGEKLGYSYKRSNKSWLKEWRAHNLLYNFNYKSLQTADVDLNEDESAIRLFMYNILSFVYKILEE